MSIAELHNKKGPEDTLTAAVLGTLTFLPAERALTPWLRCARNLHGEPLPLPIELDPLEIEFWPRLPTASGRCEPDAIVTYPADVTEAVHALVVEVKYRSGPSGLPTLNDAASVEHADVTGQLSRQWLALHSRPDSAFPSAPQKVVARRMLLVTSEAHIPTTLIKDTSLELQVHAGHDVGFMDGCFWLDWSSLHLTIWQQLEKSHLQKWERHALEFLRALLESRGLAAFLAIVPPGPRTAVPWSYVSEAQ